VSLARRIRRSVVRELVVARRRGRWWFLGLSFKWARVVLACEAPALPRCLRARLRVHTLAAGSYGCHQRRRRGVCAVACPVRAGFSRPRGGPRVLAWGGRRSCWTTRLGARARVLDVWRGGSCSPAVPGGPLTRGRVVIESRCTAWNRHFPGVVHPCQNRLHQSAAGRVRATRGELRPLLGAPVGVARLGISHARRQRRFPSVKS